MSFMEAMILAVVEGLTEYLPISSTGHLILSSWFMGIEQDQFVKDYTIMVQFGAIMAVLVLYWRRFVLNFKIYPAIAVAVAPAVVIGLSVKKHIDVLLGSVWIVAVALIVGGILLLLTDAWVKKIKPKYLVIENLTPMSALKIGLFQCLAFIPGVSRSAASIWGGLHQGMSMPLAVEFSFFLAVPTLTGASMIKFMKAAPELTSEQWSLLGWGNVLSFIVGLVAIKFFVKLVSQYGLRAFGYYRIVLGIVVLTILWQGHDL